MPSHLVTGGAGFIGVNLIPRLLDRGGDVVIVDDLSRGSIANLGKLVHDNRVKVEVVDASNLDDYRAAISRYSPSTFVDVWHLAANSDIPAGVADPTVDLNATFLSTFNTIMIMREFGIDTINFASTSAVYGDLGDVELHENIGPLEPISNYGAMKLASEAQIRAAVESNLAKANIFRFPNVVGTPATHGVMVDFVHKLNLNPSVLPVLGDGTQRKSYLHVHDLVDAMIFITEKAGGRYNVFNIGPRDAGVTVRWIAETVCDLYGGSPKIDFGIGNKGWVGDVPAFTYSTERLRTLGWSPRLGSVDAIKKAAAEIVLQEKR